MIALLRTWIMDTLGFSKSEANGTLVLLIIVFVAVLIPRLLLHNSKSAPESFAADQAALQEWVTQLGSTVKPKERQRQTAAENPEFRSFVFNPNTVTLEDLLALGFREQAARNLIRYRESGGRFATREDMKRIYGISGERIDELWDYIDLPIAPPPIPAREVISRDKTKRQFDLNTATEEELQTLRGIGPVLSHRIITFREKLGGFHSTDQLHQVYGLDSAVISDLKQHLILSGYVKKININTDSLRLLYGHPYIDYKTARAILNYRKQHGNYDSITQLKSIKIISDSLYQKIYPYLSLNP